MNATEAVLLLRKVKAHCPSQAIDEFTGEAWAEALDDIAFDDANDALLAIVKQPLELGRYRYVEPGHIRGQVTRTRSGRLAAYGTPDLPNGFQYDDYPEYMRLIKEAVADGKVDRTHPVPTIDDLRRITGTPHRPELAGGDAA